MKQSQLLCDLIGFVTLDIALIFISLMNGIRNIFIVFFAAGCELEWPQYRTVSKEEEEMPLAYVITAFSDARNLELTLATIFRSVSQSVRD